MCVLVGITICPWYSLRTHNRCALAVNTISLPFPQTDPLLPLSGTETDT